MKERRVRCLQCGARFTVVRFVRERASAYCAWCRDERRRVQARARMQLLRDRRRACRPPAGAVGQPDDHA
jgi:hypothetical protein